MKRFLLLSMLLLFAVASQAETAPDLHRRAAFFRGGADDGAAVAVKTFTDTLPRAVLFFAGGIDDGYCLAAIRFDEAWVKRDIAYYFGGTEDGFSRSGQYFSDTAGRAHYAFGGIEDGYAFRGMAQGKVLVLLSGGKSVCTGSSDTLYLSLRGGRGPWQVWIHRDSDGEEATELMGSGAYPLTLHRADTSIGFTPTRSEAYYVEKVVDVATEAEGTTSGHASVTVNEPDPIFFALSGEAQVGQCRAIDLLQKLRPNIEDRYLVDNVGTFEVDGAPLSSRWWVQSRLVPGSHAVAYRYRNANGCESRPEVQLSVDALPTAGITAQAHACGNVESAYEITLAGAVPLKVGVHQKLDRFRGEEGSSRIWPELVQTGNYQGKVRWDSEDSCLLLQVSYVTDRHGCMTPVESLPKALLYHHTPPKVEVWTRYPNEGMLWSRGISPITIHKGDSVGIRAILVEGGQPWNLVVSPEGSQAGIRGSEVVFALKQPATYRFTAETEHCRVPANDELLVIGYPETGYLRMKVLLNGPLNPLTGLMESAVEECLPLYGLETLPETHLPIIDWIEVELRTGPYDRLDAIAKRGEGCRVIGCDTCLLLADGTVADRAGDTVAAIRGVLAPGHNNYHVVLRHRNHLAVMSQKAFSIARERKSAVLADFTRPETVYRSKRSPSLTSHMTEINTGWRVFWAMSAGDMNHNRLVTAIDPNEVKVEYGGSRMRGGCAYELYDVNFDGLVEWPKWGETTGGLDWMIVRRNRYKYSEVK